MAGSVLVKQRVEEKHTAPVDGAGGGHQRNFTDAVGVFVSGKQLCQQARVLFRAVFHHLAILEGHVPALNQLTVVHIGFGAVHHTVHTVAVRRAENFLGGHVGNEFDTFFRLAGSPLPGGILGQPHRQIGAVAAGDVHPIQIPGVELVTAGGRLGHMFFPGGDRIPGGDAANVKDNFPQFFHRLIHRQFREDLGRPPRRRHSRHTPLDTIIHGVFLPGFQEGAAGQVDSVDLTGVQPGQCLGIFGMDGQRTAAIRVLGVIQVAAQLVGLQIAQILLPGQFHMQAGKLIILPPDDDLLGTGLIPGAHTGVGEVRHGDRAAHNKILAGPHIDAHLDDKIRIQLQILLVHSWFLLFSEYRISIYHFAANG